MYICIYILYVYSECDVTCLRMFCNMTVLILGDATFTFDCGSAHPQSRCPKYVPKIYELMSSCQDRFTGKTR